MAEQVIIKYYRSAVGRPYPQKRIIKALGFHRLQEERVVDWTPSMQGMVDKVPHLVKVVETAPVTDSFAVEDNPVLETAPAVDSTEGEDNQVLEPPQAVDSTAAEDNNIIESQQTVDTILEEDKKVIESPPAADSTVEESS